MYRQLKFDVIYKENGTVVREPVVRLDFDKGGVTHAYIHKQIPAYEIPNTERKPSAVADASGEFKIPETITISATVEEREIQIDWINSFVVQCSGVMDKVGALIWHGDLLKDADEKLHEVVFYNAGMFVLMGEGEQMHGVPLEDSVARKLTRVGDIFLNADLVQGKAEELNEALERGQQQQ